MGSTPTVEVDLETYRGVYTAAVPSGASTGIYEALELRDGGSEYMGKGVSKAVANINEIIAPALIGKDPTQQAELDMFMVKELDGTENEWGYCKQKLGANAILAVSMAIAKAGAAQKDVPLFKHIASLAGNENLVMPVPAFNIINGGSHAGNRLAMQEFMILPVGATSFTEAVRMATEVYHTLKTIIATKYGKDSTSVGDEGGFAPTIEDSKEALDLVVEAIDKAGYTEQMQIGMDVAAGEFLTEDKMYDLDFKTEGEDKKPDLKVTGDQLLDMYTKWCGEYALTTIEDPFDQDDWENTAALTATELCQVVGDDLLVTNPKRVARAIEEETCNALLLKVNQIGSLTEAIEAVTMAKKAQWGVMASHRSGETEDSFIADLAVGLSCGQIKSGAPCRGERTAKYNQLLRIEALLNEEAEAAGSSQGAVYAGGNFRYIKW